MKDGGRYLRTMSTADTKEPPRSQIAHISNPKEKSRVQKNDKLLRNKKPLVMKNVSR